MKKSSEIDFLATKVFRNIWESVQSKKYKLIVEEGSSRSSKTWSNFQVLFLDLYENPFTTCTILRDTQKSCREIVEVDWVKWLSDPKGRKKELEEGKITIQEFDVFIKEENLLKYFLRNKTNHTWTMVHNNSFIRFTGLDDEDDAMGMTQDICWINEPYKFSHEVYKQLSQRTSKYILFDWNPKQDHWVNTEKKKENTITLYSTFKDNPFCPKESRIQILSYQPLSESEVVINELISISDLKKYDLEKNELNFTKKQVNEILRCNYNESVKSASAYHWHVYGLGKKSEKPNRIFHWKECTVEEFENISTTPYIGIDWGKVDPFAIVKVKYHDGRLFVHELNYDSENKIRERLKPDELRQIMASNDTENGIVSYVFSKLNIDKNILMLCDTNRPEKGALLRQRGYNVIPAVKPSIMESIELVQSLDVYYTNTSTNIKIEQENYEYKVDKFGDREEQAIDEWNHSLDCIRYISHYLRIKGIIKVL